MSETATPTPIWDAQPPLGPMQLAGAGLRAAWARIGAMALLALAATVVMTALALGARQAGVSVTSGEFTAGHWAYELLKALAAAVISGLALRVLLAPAAGRFRLDAGFAIYVGLVTAGALVAAVLFALLGNLQDPTDAGKVALVILGGLLTVILTVWVYAKLLLWPIGRLMGEAVPPARSWALMRGATSGYILAIVIACLPTVIPYLLVSVGLGLELDADNATAPSIAIDEAFNASWALIGVAIAAAVYRARVLGERV